MALVAGEPLVPGALTLPPSISGALSTPSSPRTLARDQQERVAPHVQVGNDTALDFYRGFGFEVGDVVKNYYTRLEVNDAHLVSKKAPFVTKK